LLLIKSFQDEGLRLSEIRTMLADTRDGLMDFSLSPRAMTIRADIGAADEQPVQYARAAWVRYHLLPGLEIQVDHEVEKKLRHRMPELIRFINSLMEEEDPDESR
jgi:hypothetical protein